MTGYRARVAQIQELHELEGDWRPDDLAALLERLEFDDVAEMAPTEIRDMCLLALQDLEPEEAAAVVLKYKLGDLLTEGQIRNFSNDCQSERLWEQSAEMECHRAMFGVASLLSQVNEQLFPNPDALRVTVEVHCDAEAATVFVDPLDMANVIRLLAAGMGDSAILNRLFDDQIAGADFPEAAAIVWDVSAERTDEGFRLCVTSSGYWLDGLRDTEAFQWDGCLAPQ